MIVEIEPTQGRIDRWDVSCGKYVLRGARTPLLQMARLLLDHSYDPSTKIYMVRKGARSASLHTTIGVAAGLDVKERPNGPAFAKYESRESAE